MNPQVSVFSRELVALLLPLLVGYSLFHEAPDLWWQIDDTQILTHAWDYGPREYFFSPAAWQRISTAHLTPWASLSFDLDLSLFGPEPRSFYRHQLMALGGAALASYMLLRLWVGPWLAAVATTTLVAGAPLVTAGFQLMTRNYLEGLALGALALMGFVIALRSGQWRWSLLGALAYLLACTTKEIFPPLVGLLPFIPEGSRRQRLWLTLPYVVVASCYLAWRFYMLGTPIGGYGWSTPTGLATFLASLTRIRDLLFGGGGLGTAAACSLFASLLWMIVRAPHHAGLMAMVTLAAGFPLIFVAPHFDARHLIGLWWTLCVGLPLGLAIVARQQRHGHIIAIALMALPVAMALHSGHSTAQAAVTLAKTYAAYGRFWVASGEDKVLFVQPPLADMGHYFLGLTDLTIRIHGPRSFPVRAVDEIDLARVDLEHQTVWTFIPACGCIQNISAAIPEKLRDWKLRLVESPLSVDLSYREGMAYWHFGPYENGAYFVIDALDVGKIQLPSLGALRTGPRYLALHVRYDAPEGWTTYSDLIPISMFTEARQSWHRP